MRTIIAGTRDFDDYEVMCDVMEMCIAWKPTEVLCGMARGADLLGKQWALSMGLNVEEYPADWSIGKSAGYLRNLRMAQNAEALVAFWDGVSRGTDNMIKLAHKHSLRVHVHHYERED